MKPYDEQIKVWAAVKYNIDLSTIDRVEIEATFNESYACCGGRDPDCYCSYAESASMDVDVYAYCNGERQAKNSKTRKGTLDLMYGDMNKIIQEIFEAEVTSGV